MRKNDTIKEISEHFKIGILPLFCGEKVNLNRTRGEKKTVETSEFIIK